MGSLQLPPTLQFAQLSSELNQEPSVTTPVVITYDVQDSIQGLEHSTTVNPGEIKVTQGGAGLYLVAVQPQVAKDTGGSPLRFDLFLQVDRGAGFVDEPNSNVILTIKDKDITDVLILIMALKLNFEDKVRLMQRISDTGLGLGLRFTVAEVGPPTIPATPSIIFSMARVES